MSTLEFQAAVIDIQSYLKSFAMTFTRNEEDANDLTQETIMKALRYKDKYTPQTNFKAWIFTIMKNIFINNYRRKSKANTIFDNTQELYYLNTKSKNDIEPDSTYTEKEIMKEINALDEDYKKPFMMHFEGFKYKEISEEMGLPIGTVKSRIFLARKKLMEQLKDFRIDA